MKNVMRFENGMEHGFTSDEMLLLKKAIWNLYSSNDIKDVKQKEELEHLKVLFFDYLD